MRCRNCNYPLWNLRARECPECGAPFRPSEFEFVPNSVRFCCPHCDQAYYGTDGRGHLVPTAFACVRCGRPADMDEMVLRPAAGVEEEQTVVDANPWVQREGKPWWRAWLRTVGNAMVRPARLMRALPAEGETGRAWWFAIMTVALIFLCGAGIPFAAISVIMLVSGSGGAEKPLITGAGIVVGAVVAHAALIAIWGLVTHGVLVVTGGARHPIGRTYQALCYSAAANVTSAIPCLGVYLFSFVGLCWWLVSAVLMVVEAQQVRGVRATVATLALPAALLLLGVVGAFGAMAVAMSQIGVWSAQMAVGVSGTECDLVLTALLERSAPPATWPVHAVELTGVTGITGLELVATGTDTYESDAIVAGTDLETLLSLPPSERKRIIDEAIATQPAGVVAHRLGDFVFTYHGVDRVAGASGLWLVVLAPDPDSNLQTSVGGHLVVGKLGGTVASVPEAGFAAALDEQNALRAAEGLPPLPDPRQVHHDAPAVSGEER